jgi:hypothetical protein
MLERDFTRRKEGHHPACSPTVVVLVPVAANLGCGVWQKFASSIQTDFDFQILKSGMKSFL